MGAVWLSADELFMVHECAKWKWPMPAAGADPLVLAYALVGVALGVRVWRALPEGRSALALLVLAGLGAGLAAGADLGLLGAPGAPASLLLEEGGELLALSSAIALCQSPERGRLLPSLAWVAFSAGWLGLSVWLVRPWLCPARLL